MTYLPENGAEAAAVVEARHTAKGTAPAFCPAPWVRDYARFVFIPQNGKPCTREHKHTFYSCLYRRFIFPHMFHEYGA